MSVIKFDRDFSTLFNWDTDDNPTTEQDYQNAVKNWTETEMNIVDTLLWQPTTEYATGNIVKTPSLPSQYVLRCAETGTSGSAEPDYSGASVGDTVTDGSVEWVIVSLATGNVADVDASNIGVNAEIDNSELWGSAIGGGEIAEDDGRLVTGGTVHAVTSELASDIATNTEAITTNTANIEASAVKIDIDDKRISNIEKLLQGNLYDYQTDSTSAYTKTVLNGAMPYASLEQIGGRTLVWNQLLQPPTSYTVVSGSLDGVVITIADDTVNIVGTATSDCMINIAPTAGTVPANHKLFFRRTGSGFSWGRIGFPAQGDVDSFIHTYASNFGAGIRIAITSGTTYNASSKFNIHDLTLMFGSGNEPTTVQEFTAQFPANYYAFTQGQLLSAGVTEVKSVGKNVLDLSNMLRVSSGYNFYNIPNTLKPNTTYTYTVSGEPDSYNSKFGLFIASNGTQTGGTTVRLTGYINNSSVTFTTPADMYGYPYLILGGTPRYAADNTNYTFQIEAGTTATPYTPYRQPITYPIPAEIRNLEGYGWSAGSVFNYIDFERKVFVKCVDKIVLDGTQAPVLTNWRPLTNSVGWAYGVSTPPNAKKPSANSELANILTDKLPTTRYSGENNIYSTDASAVALSDSTNYGLFVRVMDTSLTTATAINNYLSANPITVYYELATPQEIDISEYITDDNLIEVESGGTLTFPNSNGTDYQIPVPSSETYMVDLQSALGE